MISTNLKIAFRQLFKNRGISLINLWGLAFGLAAAMGVVLYVKDELSFESFHENIDRIVKVNLEAEFDGQAFLLDAAPNAAAPLLKERIPEVEEAVRVFPHKYGETAFVRVGDQNYSEENLFWADSNLLKVFTLNLKSGNPDNVLKRVNTVILSESTAYRYFGNTNPIGKTIRVDSRDDLEITGIFEDVPKNTHYPFELIGSFHTIPKGKPDRLIWGDASYKTFLLLNPASVLSTVQNKVEEALKAGVPEDRQWFSLKLQPMDQVHLYSGDYVSSDEPYGDIRQVRILIGLAVLLLLTACINYMNLATAKSQQRSKEVGVIKTLGASSWSIARQFYFETALITLLGIVFSVIIIWFSLPFFNQLSGKELTLSFLLDAWFWVITFAVWIGVTIVAGAYPAAFLSSFTPMAVLKQNAQSKSGVGLVRKGLVIFQFCVSTILIISTLVFYQQLNFISNKKLGYQPEQVVAIKISGVGNRQMTETLEKEIDKLSPVLSSALAQTIPGGSPSGRSLYKENATEQDQGGELWTCRVFPDYFEVLNLEFIAGKPVKQAIPGDTITEVVLNRSAVEFLGYTPEEAIGRRVDANLGDAEIVGVVENFHFGSLRNKIGHFAFHNRNSEWLQYIVVKLKGDQVFDAINQLGATFNKIVPQIAFDYTFLDDNLAALYETEKRLASVIFLFAGLAIFVACLGLFALIAFTAEQRTKEIGVRKVLGASVSNIISLLSMDFIKLVLISILLAAPLAWWAMNRWLEGFAYRIELQWWTFGLASLIAILIALLTVTYQGFRAAMVNPVEALRNE